MQHVGAVIYLHDGEGLRGVVHIYLHLSHGVGGGYCGRNEVIPRITRGS